MNQRGRAGHAGTEMQRAMQVALPRFTLTALYGTIGRLQTRTKATLAMVLADRLFREGHHDIRVIDPAGVRHGREEFRLTLRLVERLSLPFRLSRPRFV